MKIKIEQALENLNKPIELEWRLNKKAYKILVEKGHIKTECQE